jgi:hypothetical protein
MSGKIEERSRKTSDPDITGNESRDDEKNDDDLYVIAKDIVNGMLIHGVKRG